MGFLDRAKEAAHRARAGARVAREQGQHRLSELQARRQAEVLLREVGLASYEEQQGVGGHEAVVRAVAKLDEHVRTHNIDLSTSGLRGYLRTAAGSGDDFASRGSRPPAGESAVTDRPTDQPAGGKAATNEKAAEPAGAEPVGEETEEPEHPSEPDGRATKAAAKKTAKKTTAKKTAKKVAKKTTAKKTASPALDETTEDQS